MWKFTLQVSLVRNESGLREGRVDFWPRFKDQFGLVGEVAGEKGWTAFKEGAKSCSYGTLHLVGTEHFRTIRSAL